jgi:predicted DNA-binding transcriptional regulator AlpA
VKKSPASQQQADNEIAVRRFPSVPLDRFLSRGQVLDLIGVKYPTLWLWIRDGKFPPARVLGPDNSDRARIGWLESEVVGWMTARPVRRPKGSRTESETRGAEDELPPGSESASRSAMITGAGDDGR